MKKLIIGLLALSCMACNGKDESAATDTINKKTLALNVEKKAPAIELVFCLDATGSMGGLIHTAKEKIWDIVTLMSQSEPTPDIRLGMVFYRDRGDDFVTRSYPLTNDIDSIYSELLLITASGGGDSPESVNQALDEAVAKIGWKSGQNIYRSVFLVGDCAPHMDYQDDVKYPTSCKLANEKSIVINTIKLGNQCSDAIPHFKAIATATNGEYKQLGQNADDVIIETPYDDSISHYSTQIDASKLYYGSSKKQREMKTKQEKALQLNETSSANAMASRAKYNMSKAGKKNMYGSNELVDELLSNKVKLEDIEEKELPEEIKKVDKGEREKHLNKLKKTRTQNISKLTRLNKKREEYISNNKDKDSTAASFSNEIYKVVKGQAKEKGVKIVKADKE